MNIEISLFIAALVALGGGCVVEHDGGPSGPQDGTIDLDWTVAGTKDPSQCDAAGATTFDVIVETPGGGQVGEFQSSCDSFSMEIPIAPGSYVANAVLLGSSGASRTTQIETAPFDVDTDSSVVIPVDFPSDSFE